MPGYDEDAANSQVNTTILEQEFNLDTTEERNRQIQEIRDMRLNLSQVINNSDDNPDTILLTNITRANTLLDTAQNAINNGGETNARLFEVCAQLINAITSAATSVQNSSFGLMKHEYNMETIKVKEREIAVKAAIAQDRAGKKSNHRVNGSVVVMSREELLNMIEQDDKEVEIESAGEENTEQDN